MYGVSLESISTVVMMGCKDDVAQGIPETLLLSKDITNSRSG
jgi:hypothetical protein